MQIKTIEIAGFEASFKAMRLPMRSGEKSDSIWEEYHNIRFDRIVGEKDLVLAKKLIKAGDEHAKHMRGIKVWMELTAKDWFWDELCTYEVGVTKLPSTSSMHGEFKNLSGEELEKMRDDQPRGYEYTRIYVWNYQSLRHVYHQRKNHRLPTWRKFCDWIRSLPLAEELIICE